MASVAYGQKRTTSPDSGTMTNLGRACVYAAMPENGWAYRYHVQAGRTGGTTPFARGHVLAVSGGEPTDLLGNTGELTAPILMGSGDTPADVSGDLTAVVPLSSGTAYALGLASRGAQILHGMVQSAALPSGLNRNFYVRDSIGSTGPYDPWADTASSIQGWITQWVDYEPNIKPDVPIELSPSGLVSSSPSAYTGAFRDANETVNGGPNGAEELNQFRIQLREADSESLKWDTTLTADSGEKTGRAFSRAYAGSGAIDAGQAYQWRSAVSDHFGEWSDWSDWVTFQVGSAGQSFIQGSPGVSGRITTLTPTGFAVSYTHPDTLDTDSQEIQILSGGVPIREQTITDTHSSGDSFTLAPVWGGGGGEWASLNWSMPLTWRWRAVDSTDAPTAWSDEVTFNTNYRPSTPGGLSPAGDVVDGLPLLTFSMIDQDDTPVTGLTAEVRIKTNGGSLISTRAATHIDGATWGYQPTEADMANTGIYKWDARGQDADLDGSWSVEANVFYYDAPEVSSPAPDATVASSSLAIVYDIDIQERRRFLIYREGTDQLLTSTDWEETASLTASIDLSAVAINGGRYELVVVVEQALSIFTRAVPSPRTPFSVLIDPPHSVSADPGQSGAVAVGAEPDTSAIRMVRDTVDGIDGGNFVAWRIKEGPSDWLDRWNAIRGPMPEPLLLLPLNGSLAGTDGSGPMTATGTGSVRYVGEEGEGISWSMFGDEDYARWLSEAVALTAELETVAESRSFEATELTYYEPMLGRQPRVYALVAVIQDGINQVESLPANPILASCDATAIVISDVNNPTGLRAWLAYLKGGKGEDQMQQTVVATWNDDGLPTILESGSRFQTISETFQLLPKGGDHPLDVYATLGDLRGWRDDGSSIVVCFRDDLGQRLYGRITKRGYQREWMGRLTVPLELTEVRRG